MTWAAVEPPTAAPSRREPSALPLRLRGDGVPGRVVGWWPDSGHLVLVEPEPSVLSLGTEAVELALGGAGTSLRSAA